MKKYVTAYALWLLGVLSAAAVAFYYYRKVLALGEEALRDGLHKTSPPDGARQSEDAQSSPPPAEPPASIEEAVRRRGTS